jgi:integrase
MTVGEWANYCLEHIFPNMPSRRGRGYSPRTIQGYAGIIELNIQPLLGDILLDKLTPEHIDKLLAQYSATQTKLNIRNLGSTLYVIAEQRKKVSHGFNPFKSVQIARPRKERHENGQVLEHVRILSEKELKSLLKCAKEHPDYHWTYTPILLGMKLGLRSGEVLGLEWKNVDFEKRTVRITQQRQRVTKKTRERMGLKGKGGLLVVEPKTDSGYRTIPMPNSVYEWLKEERKRNQTPFVVPNELGTNAREPRRYNGGFKKLVEKLKLHESKDEHGTPLPVPTHHDLRHTFCSRMANEFKVPVQILKVIAGHSDVHTTLSYYVHANEAGIAEAMV